MRPPREGNALTAILEATRPPVFSALEPQPADVLLGLIKAFRDDPRAGKIDLGVGVFRDGFGKTPVMASVKSAEQQLLRNQATKSYLGPEGDQGYVDLLAHLVFGPQFALSPALTGVQTPGGTGALCLGAELIARARPGATVWVGAPTWPNHLPIFQRARLRTRLTRFYDQERSILDIDGMLEDLGAAQPGDVILLHGCCHNPTGAAPEANHWYRIRDFCAERGLLPFIDLAYQGLGDGLEEDAAATRQIVAQFPEVMIAYSCDKNFGLYRERVGAFWIKGASAEDAALARANVLAIAREIWSMPPDHGAAIVRIILASDALRSAWQSELSEMRGRINELRTALASAHPGLASIGQQRGMFALLPVAADVPALLREKHGIYMAGNGRINIAGLNRETIPGFVAGIAPYLK